MKRIAVMCAIAMAALGVVTATGCVRVALPEPRQTTDSDEIAREGATELTASINMGAGRLKVSGGAAGAMDATYVYTDEE